MSFIEDGLNAAQEVIEELMLDTCRITRGAPDRKRTLDRSTGQTVQEAAITIYEGDCKIKSTERLAQTAYEGGAENVLARYEVDIPIGLGEPLEGDDIEILTSSRDPALVGLHMRVTNPEYTSFATKRRMLAERRRKPGDRP